MALIISIGRLYAINYSLYIQDIVVSELGYDLVGKYIRSSTSPGLQSKTKRKAFLSSDVKQYMYIKPTKPETLDVDHKFVFANTECSNSQSQYFHGNKLNNENWYHFSFIKVLILCEYV